MPPTVLITRPEPLAFTFADAVRERLGCATPLVISPVIGIDYLDTDVKAGAILVFTSVHGVEAYARLTASEGRTAYCVGASTGQAAREYGFDTIEAGGDAVSLLSLIKTDAPSAPLLHISGEHVAADIKGELRRAGLNAERQVLYRQTARALTDEALSLFEGQVPILIPLFSPRSARLLFDGLQSQAPLFIAAMSQNVADFVPEAAQTRVSVAKIPDAASMLDGLESLHADAIRLEGARGAQ